MLRQDEGRGRRPQAGRDEARAPTRTQALAMRRRRFLALAGAGALATPAAAAGGPAITVLKAWGCTCCEGWIEHMQRAGFRAQVVVVNDLSVEWRRRGVPDT